ncbi:MAG: hypothetical protein ACTSPN_08520, partial [Promethearchaeota archaeon]
ELHSHSELRWDANSVHKSFFSFQPCEIVMRLGLNIFWTNNGTIRLKLLQPIVINSRPIKISSTQMNS